MMEKHEPSRLIANCLKCIKLGSEIRDLEFMKAWMTQARSLAAVQGSEDQHDQLRIYEEEIRVLEELEAVGGAGSALLRDHPLVIGREKILRRRAERIKGSVSRPTPSPDPG